ncbi:hypothetical protein Cni_G05670 [Canna indica]|uniref:C2H2-type domain-containing protein n=1 Tax=Canna indica TaxID=4628 RepID=A0AAQ3JXJ2_9LILI|nr:hypothetical protein Cni_G05670 [Canna indica]
MRSTMEQTRNWMWAKLDHSSEKLSVLGSQNRSSSLYAYDQSWEERAFAEDSAGRLGGCIWPPRSYSCSFCKREFRSAQALGGHMNVHRRDRARLKQSLSPNRDENIDHHPLHTPNSNPCTCLAPPLSSTLRSVSLDSAATARRIIVSEELKVSTENSNPSEENINEEVEEEEDNTGVKRRRTDFKFSAISVEKVQSEVLKQSPFTVEELDLELRLGQKRKPVTVEQRAN